VSNQIEIFQLAEEAFQQEATDLFLQEDSIPRVRIANGIQNISDSPISHDLMKSFWQSCHADPETTHEKDTSYTTRSDRRLRVNLYKSMGKLAAVLRPIKSDIPTLDEIGAPRDLLTNWASRASGMIIVAGPTGSGKSTTLASTIDWVNQHQAKHIITIEDPIEYLFSNQMGYFSQRELNADTMSLAAALRQSPDIIILQKFVFKLQKQATLLSLPYTALA